MSILERFGLRPPTHKRPPTNDAAPKFNPHRMSDAQRKAIDDARKRDSAYAKAQREKRTKALKAHPDLRDYIVTLEAVAPDMDAIFRGVLDIDIEALIEECKLSSLPYDAREVALQETRRFVSLVNARVFGMDIGDEIPWVLPEGVTYTFDDANKALFPPGSEQEYGSRFSKDDTPNTTEEWLAKYANQL